MRIFKGMSSKGIRCINLSEGDKIVSLSIIDHIKKSAKSINDENFKCVASFYSPENGSESQTDFPDELTFTFKQKGYESTASCNDLNQTKLRKCWELETPFPANII